MSLATLLSLLLSVLVWCLVCGALVQVGRFLSRHHPFAPGLWWALLVLSFVPFAPLPEMTLDEVIPTVLYDFSEQAGKLQLSTEIMLTTENQWNDLWIFIALIFVMVLQSIRKGMCLLNKLASLRALMSSAEPLQADLSASFSSLTQIKGRQVPVYVLPLNCTAFAMGVKKPTIVMPQYFATLPEYKQRTLLLHEVTHLAHRDHIALMVWQVLKCLFWFNPAIARMEAAFINAMEARCDAQTIGRYGIDRQQYAATLLDALKHSTLNKTPNAVAGFASQALSLADYKSRLVQIMKPVKTRHRFVTLNILAIAMFSAFVSFQVRPLLSPQTPNWQLPMNDYKISSHFGHVWAFRNHKPHGGLDMVAAKGTPLGAMATGKVLVADEITLAKNYGKTVLIQHSNGYQSLYAHLDSIAVSQGDWVSAGEVIGTLGDSGRVTGAHLHLEILADGKRLDPLSIFPKD
ncbi:peptidoglycan DD-metalloendopeptidase family protein [Pseudoalteromonas rubra]|uniref:Peptidoglycan DD-metalloendopeptidase family protein n=1 Tax=Pseudoalteromonas rubra TaxID=43658 RepID=A0A5S3USM4_9GAMM|nr:M23/M56 family metallopeptidase [Pseudoalteromonas rubra]QPB85598.1 peptidoglycan DD-metalloendopeptidase family protein [Pseudoalteromonas rubra]